ncbi:DUF3857 domain-containing protein [bacterium]|nr:DUF3857 domain-containing protein [bacterium]MBU1985380.1 DUF3857 domain-containing protein [bacterium]
MRIRESIVLFAVWLLVVFTTPNLRAGELDSLLDGIGGADVYPQASAVILYDREIVKLDSVGFTYKHREFLCRILDERGASAFREQVVQFDSGRDTVIIEAARVRLADGTWIEPEPEAFTLSLAPEVKWAAAYSRLKEQRVSFPNLDVGAALYFAYRIEPKPGTKAPATPHTGDVVLFGDFDPVLEKSYVIETAVNRRIRFEMTHDSFDPVVTEADGCISYQWTKRDIPPVVPEPDMVNLSFIVPRLAWTTFADWEDLGLFVSENFWEKVELSEEAVQSWSAITAPDLQAVPALMNVATFVLHRIRSVHLPFGRIGYEPNSADRVWQNGYGDSQDKAVLLTALMRGYGYGPIPVLVSGEHVPFSNLPVLEQFRHVILAVPIGSDTLWVDPMAEYYPPGMLPYADTYGMGCMLLPGIPLIESVPPGPTAMRGARTEIRATLTSTGDLSGRLTCIPRGDQTAQVRARFRDLSSEDCGLFAESAAGRIRPGTRVTNFSVSNVVDLSAPVVVSLGFESPNYATRENGHLLMEIPLAPFEFARPDFFPSLPEVRYPVKLPGRAQFIGEFTLTIPDGFQVAAVPPTLLIDNPFVRMEVHSRRGEATMTWTQTIEIKADLVPPGEFATVRQAFEAIELPKYRLVLMEKK